jgi:hypothetical protein
MKKKNKFQPDFEIVVASCGGINWVIKVKPGTSFPTTYTHIIDGLQKATQFYELEQRTKGDNL